MSVPISDTEYLIVGSGLTGATIARVLHDAGKRVLIVDRRPHMGGNVHDQPDPATGILFHTYGPHYFRTNSQRIWRFVNRFSTFVEFHPTMKTMVDGVIEDWPLGKSQVARFAGTQDWLPDFDGIPRNFEEACLARLPRIVYDKFIKGYTEKQWGKPATELSPELAKRVLVLDDKQKFLPSHLHEALPSEGYATFMRRLLNGIPIILNFDYLNHRTEISGREQLIYTGPIDEYFDCDLGALKYRGQRRESIHRRGQALQQPVLQLNNPSCEHGTHIRTIEWKHLLSEAAQQSIPHTLLTREHPYTPDDPDHFEYPFPDEVNAKLYQSYRQRAEQIRNLLICGRLGEYRYYDMDQAIGKALVTAEKLLRTNTVLTS